MITWQKYYEQEVLKEYQLDLIKKLEELKEDGEIESGQKQGSVQLPNYFDALDGCGVKTFVRQRIVDLSPAATRSDRPGKKRKP